MGWEWWNGALSQRFNLAGILSSVTVVSRDSHLALPHLSVPDLRWIDWSHLYNRGFRGVVFDKDNTLTTPFSLTLSPTLATSLDRCKSTFGHTKLAVFSNSAGEKKPAGTTEDIEKYFGCETSLLVMVGDRHFTDIVYGNRNGFLTILTEPLNPAEEPFIVKQVRKLEACLVNYWYRKGLKPISHHLLPDGAEKCAEDPQLL
ncbi:haloacid dehalogenase (HAD) superfamily protein isoform X2 [Tasmannia lanceolata]|uniref:haloacid dehalogenase (HAD) superfamily protein isoform X2 n=1 Tax=Tasmannia lanceolata TaxID=3420 RepID=UPI00406327BA